VTPAVRTTLPLDVAPLTVRVRFLGAIADVKDFLRKIFGERTRVLGPSTQ